MEIFKVVLTSLLSAATLFVIAKIMGHKQMAQLDFFDYINGITIGSIAAELATELESPLQPLIAMVIYGAVSLCLTIVAHKFPKTRKFINGTPTIIMNNGKLYRKKSGRGSGNRDCRPGAGYFVTNRRITWTQEKELQN